MIIIDLCCRDKHRFEAWFRSAGDFTDQQARRLVSCPHCGDLEVHRIPSASHIATGAVAPKLTDQNSSTPTSLAALKAAVEQILATTENVGRNFPEEARRIYYKESKARSIYGEATSDEYKALHEEGIDVLRLPVVKPKDLN